MLPDLDWKTRWTLGHAMSRLVLAPVVVFYPRWPLLVGYGCCMVVGNAADTAGTAGTAGTVDADDGRVVAAGADGTATSTVGTADAAGSAGGGSVAAAVRKAVADDTVAFAVAAPATLDF